jgi:hypothetical protein
MVSTGFDIPAARVVIDARDRPAGAPPRVTITADLPGGGRLEARGTTALPPAVADLQVVLAGVDLRQLRPYVPTASPVTLERGRLEATLRVRHDSTADLRVSGTAAVLGGVLLRRGQAQPFVIHRRLEIVVQDLTLRGSELAIAQLALTGAPTILDASVSPPQRLVFTRLHLVAAGATWPARGPARVELSATVEGSTLRHPAPLVRVAAAASYFAVSAEPARLLPVLARELRSRDRLARDVAATALARVAPDHPRLAELTSRKPRARRRGRAHTSLLVHGTFARNHSWWQPGGDFHKYLHDNVRPDLYGAGDRFEWSGGYSDGARALGATDLRAWVFEHSAAGLDLFTHSHGGSVAMLASHHPDMTVGTLVLLSCPVHVPKYVPDFSRVERAVSVRVHCDLVILIDGGGQRFRDRRIDEHVLPIWFDHSATHDADVWQAHDVPRWL